MAGVEYPISDRLSLDLGYRYLNLGDAQTASVTDAQGVSSRMKYEDITAHEVRVGSALLPQLILNERVFGERRESSPAACLFGNTFGRAAKTRLDGA